MTEHEAIQSVVAESYRTKIDAEDLRREIKALLNTVLYELEQQMPFECWLVSEGEKEAYTKVLKLIDEKEKNG